MAHEDRLELVEVRRAGHRLAVFERAIVDLGVCRELQEGRALGDRAASRDRNAGLRRSFDRRLAGEFFDQLPGQRLVLALR